MFVQMQTLFLELKVVFHCQDLANSLKLNDKALIF